ncbi:hypothetical protein [Streptomyces sp. NP-1717]|nr:hypothetical protein [Streptomyces sp. NP-1717]
MANRPTASTATSSRRALVVEPRLFRDEFDPGREARSRILST